MSSGVKLGLDWSTLGEIIGKRVNRCGIRGCPHFSIGVVCSVCSRFVCLSHAYFKVSLPPQPLRGVCAACVIESHPELLQQLEE